MGTVTEYNTELNRIVAIQSYLHVSIKADHTEQSHIVWLLYISPNNRSVRPNHPINRLLEQPNNDRIFQSLCHCPCLSQCPCLDGGFCSISEIPPPRSKLYITRGQPYICIFSSVFIRRLNPKTHPTNIHIPKAHNMATQNLRCALARATASFGGGDHPTMVETPASTCEGGSVV